MLQILTITTTTLAVIAALVGMRIAAIEIRDNIDEFINDLHRQGRWQKWSAAINLLAAAALVASQCLVLFQAN
jgi:hypothetical protein